MQNRMATPMDDTQMAHYAAQQVAIAWSPDQMVRLEHEWRQLQRNFAYHPAIRIIPLHGNPPAEYTVEFKARTLYIRDDGQLDYIPNPSIHIWLPPGYPHEPPVVRPVEALFHPNITMDGILMNPAWEPTRTLAQLVQQIGALIAYHTYDPWNVWNPAAMEWVAANAAYLPTDPTANFTPNAAGEPLGRICQNGPRTVEQLRNQLQELCTALLSPADPPSTDDVRTFADHLRQTTPLFLDPDVPESLRMPATELDQWAEALPTVTMVFEGLRQRHLAASAALAAAGKLADSRRTLLKELSSFEELVKDQPSADPRQALAQLPELPKMQAFHAGFKVGTAEAEKRLASARATLAALVAPDPRTNFSHSELLEKTIEAEIGRAAAAVADAREKAIAAIDALAPAVERARDELAAFDRAIGWREYADLTAKSREIVDRILAWGSAGVQAYFVENEGGAYGPFEFEQRLDLGDSALAVRNTGRTAIEIFDIKSGGKVAVSDTGETAIQLPGGEDGTAYETTFRMTGRCDDLWVQLEYLSRQIGATLARLRKPLSAPKAHSWAAAFAQVFSNKTVLGEFVEETKAGLIERDNLVSDLKLLGRFKERMTTQLLLERHAEMVARFKKALADTEKEMRDANQRIADIFSRSQREVETGQPMIPPKLAKEYETQSKRRDGAQRKIDRLNRRFDTAVAQIKPRLSTPALYGSDAVPSPMLLPALPAELLARAELMSEDAMSQQIANLEQDLSAPLRPDARATKPRPPQAPAKPVEPAEALPPPVAQDITADLEPAHAAVDETEFAVQEEHHEGEEVQADFIDFDAGRAKQ